MAMAAPWSSPSCCPATASTSAPRLLGPRSLRGAASSAGSSSRSCKLPRRRQLSVCATAAAPPPPVDYAGNSNASTDADYVASLKVKLLSAVSGLNRGLAASQEDLDRADAAARELEAAGGGPVDLNKDLDRLQGRWRLVYSSAFSSRTLGGSRPGPPTGRLLPITLGQVFQRIDVVSRDFDNIVELELGAPWPLPPVEATATLAHKFEVVGESPLPSPPLPSPVLRDHLVNETTNTDAHGRRDVGHQDQFREDDGEDEGEPVAAAAAGGAADPRQPPAAVQHRERRVRGDVPRRRHARHPRGQGRAPGLRHRVSLASDGRHGHEVRIPEVETSTELPVTRLRGDAMTRA
ncbi:hypothetical protein SEVIR_8G183100v4 [Setaria viridis]